MSVNNIDGFSDILKNFQIDQKNNFRVGQILKAKVMGFSEGKPILNIKGDIFQARSEVPLKIKQELHVVVKKKEGSTTYLKIVDPDSTDKESRLINSLIKNGLSYDKISLFENLIKNGLSERSALLLMKNSLPENSTTIELFKSLDNIGEKISTIKDLYSLILKNLSPEKTRLFKSRFFPDTLNKQSIMNYIKESLSSTESKLLNSRSLDADIKTFLSKEDAPVFKDIIRYIDLNHLLSKDERKEVFLQIPFLYQGKTEEEMNYSQLNFSSEDRISKKKAIDIQFILDMTNIDMLKVDARYFIRGKNLAINFSSKEKGVLEMIELYKDELHDNLKDINIVLNTYLIKPEEKNNMNPTDHPINYNGRIDFKV